MMMKMNEERRRRRAKIILLSLSIYATVYILYTVQYIYIQPVTS
jgi:hypothetical protein